MLKVVKKKPECNKKNYFILELYATLKKDSTWFSLLLYFFIAGILSLQSYLDSIGWLPGSLHQQKKKKKKRHYLLLVS